MSREHEQEEYCQRFEMHTPPGKCASTYHKLYENAVLSWESESMVVKELQDHNAVQNGRE